MVDSTLEISNEKLTTLLLTKALLNEPAHHLNNCTNALEDTPTLFEKTIYYAERPLHVICTNEAIIYAGFIHAQYSVEYQRARARELLSKHCIHKNAKTNIASWPTNTPLPTTLCLLGTDFQRRIWQALLCIPSGNLTTYKTLGEWLTPNSKGYQAIGNAVGANPISGIIPCHRIVPNPSLNHTRKDKISVGGFYWGADLKIQLLSYELKNQR